VLKSKSRIAILGIVLGIILTAVAVALYFTDDFHPSIDWTITLAGKNHEEQTLSYQGLLKLQTYEANGGFFTTVGVVNGPYRVKGIVLKDLCKLVGGVSDGDAVMVSATDGYSMVYDYAQLSGGIITYDPVTLKEMPHEEQLVMLIYEINNIALPQSDGPVRIAVVGNESLLTEGHYWVKRVNKIEVLTIK
jgi:hypothetical protein